MGNSAFNKEQINGSVIREESETKIKCLCMCVYFK